MHSPKPNSSADHGTSFRWGADLSAGVVVFLVAVPLCLGIALASGAPLLAGLIAGIVGGLVVGSLSGSAIGVSGPAAGLAVIVLSAIEALGSFPVFLVAVVLAGLLQIGLGFVRAGVLAHYFPSSVIKGMLAGIGVILILKQLPHFVGWNSDPLGQQAFAQPDGETTFSALAHLTSSLSLGPLLAGVVALALLLVWSSERIKSHRVLSKIPGPLLAVISGVILQRIFGDSGVFAFTADQLVRIPQWSGVSELTSLLVLPDPRGLLMPEVYWTAIVLAIVASVETLLCVEAGDKLDPLKRVTPTNRELKAQGVGNIVSGLLGGLPVTQVIVRSAANAQAGARTKLSAIFHGFLLLIAVLLLPGLMNLIPLSTLAAVLLLVGYKLVSPALLREMSRRGPSHLVPFVATVAGILFTDLLLGVGIGVHVAVIFLLLENHALPFHPKLRDDDGRLRLVLPQQVTFLHKARLRQLLASVGPSEKIVIDARESTYVHQDVREIIAEFLTHAPFEQIQVEVLGDLHPTPPRNQENPAHAHSRR